MGKGDGTFRKHKEIKPIKGMDPLDFGKVPRRGGRSARRLFLTVLVAVVVGVSALGMLVTDFNRYVAAPEPGLEVERIVAIDQGMSFRDAARKLGDKGVISRPSYFMYLARQKNVDTKIKAGEYTFTKGMTPAQILDIITRGDVTVWKLKVIEGMTIRDIAARLEGLGHWQAEEFLEIVVDEDRCDKLGIPIASMEGYLFPAHYNLKISMTEEDVVNLMLDRGLREKTDPRLARAAKMERSWHEILTMASMIEKEAIYADEKPIIASVFYSRLDKNMRLQSDPTAVYDLDDFTPPVTKKHLKRDSPYNTYRIKGLPPGPICNPGKDAIVAALTPSDDEYLYFVATGDGRHAFSKNYVEHRKNIKKYLKNK